ncbi:MAG: hypothetical protein KF878_28015 [Planctomycetes bacterium]|nr:hypothetical protein [Planctomycetota bacterium]
MNDPHDHLTPLPMFASVEPAFEASHEVSAPDGQDHEPRPEASPPPRRKTPVTLFEIGVVYRKNSRYYLAVSERMLITFKSGQLQEIRPYARYDVVRSISVEELCQKWGIPLDHLDEVTSKYLAPSAEGVKPRPRGSRRQRAADELAWRCLRTIRLLAG